MTDLNKLYESWTVDGSYLNNMLVCGNRYNDWVEAALRYLPAEILDTYKEDLVFLSTTQMDACRVARRYCESREIIILSERILPKKGAHSSQPKVRYFIFVVLHEIAHAIMKHKSPKFDKLSVAQNRTQEQEADMLSFNWFNTHIEESNDGYSRPLTREELERERAKNRQRMEQLYAGNQHIDPSSSPS